MYHILIWFIIVIHVIVIHIIHVNHVIIITVARCTSLLGVALVYVGFVHRVESLVLLEVHLFIVLLIDRAQYLFVIIHSV